MLPNSDLTIKNLLANSTRIGFFHVLEKMGAIVTWQNIRKEVGEIVGDVNVKSQPLSGIDLQGDMIPSIIDEIPIIALLATQADSPTSVRNAEELRYKESDRIDAICYNIKKMGIDIIEMKDGFIINPENKLKNASLPTINLAINMKKKFNTLPFCNRFIKKIKPNYMNNIKELLDYSIINTFPPLYTKNINAQYEHTIIIENGKKHILSFFEDY